MEKEYCTIEELQNRMEEIVKVFSIYLNPEFREEKTVETLNTETYDCETEVAKKLKLSYKSLYRRMRLADADIVKYSNRFYYNKQDIDIIEKSKKPKGMKQIGLGILHKATLERLKKKNVVFEVEKRFKDCKLPFDIYLPEHNIAVEIQGPQHFFPSTNWNEGSVQRAHLAMQRQLDRDNQKRNFCKSKGIDLIWVTVDSDIDDFIKYLDDRDYKANWFHRNHLPFEDWLNNFDKWLLFAYRKNEFLKSEFF